MTRMVHRGGVRPGGLQGGPPGGGSGGGAPGGQHRICEPKPAAQPATAEPLGEGPLAASGHGGPAPVRPQAGADLPAVARLGPSSGEECRDGWLAVTRCAPGLGVLTGKPGTGRRCGPTRGNACIGHTLFYVARLTASGADAWFVGWDDHDGGVPTASLLGAAAGQRPVRRVLVSHIDEGDGGFVYRAFDGNRSNAGCHNTECSEKFSHTDGAPERGLPQRPREASREPDTAVARSMAARRQPGAGLGPSRAVGTTHVGDGAWVACRGATLPSTVLAAGAPGARSSQAGREGGEARSSKPSTAG